MSTMIGSSKRTSRTTATSSTSSTSAPKSVRKSTTPVRDGFEAGRSGAASAGALTRSGTTGRVSASSTPDASTAVRNAGSLIEKGGRLLEQNGVPGAGGIKDLGKQVSAVGRSPTAPTTAAATSLIDRAKQTVADVKQGLGSMLPPAVQQGLNLIDNGVGALSSAVGPSGRTMAARPDAASQKWMAEQNALSPMAPATVQSIGTPGGTLNEILVKNGIDPKAGQLVQPPKVGVMPQLPQVSYTMTKEQAAELAKSFDLDTFNSNSAGAGQTENRGLRTSESFTKGDHTLYRMAVYPIPGDPNNVRVGFYAEAVPAWSKGAAMIGPTDKDGHQSGVRLGLDRPAGVSPEDYAKWVAQQVTGQ